MSQTRQSESRGNKPVSSRDAETARLILEHDPEGLRRLLEDHAGRARYVLRKEFGDVLGCLDIDSALSEATLRVWQLGPHAFDPRRGSLSGWFLAIARNCARRIRSAKRYHAMLPLTGTMLVKDSVVSVPVTD